MSKKDKSNQLLSTEEIDRLLNGATTHEEVFGEGGIYRTLTKQLFERMLETELTHHLGYEKHQKPLTEQTLERGGNSRNGTSSKTVDSLHGPLQMDIARDRNGTFEPRVIPKGTTRLPEIERMVLALYGGGMSTRDIAKELNRAYGIDASPAFISDVTDSIVADVEQWRARPLDAVYPVAFFDGIHLKVRESGKVITKCLYVAIGIGIEGRKHCLGIWLSQVESASFWLGVFTNLRNRGVEDILIATTDGLPGFTEAIAAVFPQCIHQTCIVHLLRNSMALVSHTDRKAVAASLRAVYTAPTEEEGLRHLDAAEQEWGAKYPALVQSWYNNWHKVMPMYSFTAELRKLIYTSNPIESINRVLRKSIKTRTIFPNDMAVYKLMYLSISNSEERWTIATPNWSQAINQLIILFPGRIAIA
jgi:putative transposase